ncbi:hypothetical protein [Lagierella sp.]|uniref:hypothetical protein n=1 Tax=Lagierella sp. TaxID=2849657 RepID=UPI002620561B|nr:hypothetical protein [Lagierella sp.]
MIWIVSISLGYYLEKTKTKEEGFEKLDKMLGAYLSKISLGILPIIILSIVLSKDKSDYIVAVVGSLIILLQILVPSALIIVLFKNRE